MQAWRKILAVTAAVAVLFGAAACGMQAAHSGEGVPVRAAVAAPGRVQAEVEISGSLLPARTVNVTSKLAGSVRAVHADVGDKVAAGQLLVELDAKELQAQLQQAEAAVRQVKEQAEQAKLGVDTARLNKEVAQLKVQAARLDLENLQKNYDRVKALAEAGAAPQSQLDDLQTRLAQAEMQYEMARKQYELAAKQQESAEKQYAIATGAGLAQAEAARNVLQVQLTNAAITSPLTGTVTNRYVNPGEIVAPGAPLLTVAEMTVLKLQGTVGQEVVPLLAVGQRVPVMVDAFPGKEFQGEITQIGPVAVSTGQRFPVEIKVTNPGELRPGMTARAVIRLKGPEGIIIPASAVRYESGRAFVFVLDAGGVARRRAVTLGLADGERTTVLKGLAAGERVAVSNVGVLQEGMATRVEP